MDTVKLSLANRDGLSDYLGSFDVFGSSTVEGANYLRVSLERLLLTLRYLPAAPAPGGQLLELGANPYFLTLLLERFTKYKLTLANYFGEAGPADGHGIQSITSERYGVRRDYAYDHFNGETEDFPYADGSFDVVLNCEILEHLPLDPTHFLCECHRVLKPDGHLLLTTPNVLAFQNLWRLANRANIYDMLSGYGVYGRHNREYTPMEACDLLVSCGFSVATLRTADIFPHARWVRLLKRVRPVWRDNLFILAVRQGAACHAYPTWLYRSLPAGKQA